MSCYQSTTTGLCQAGVCQAGVCRTGLCRTGSRWASCSTTSEQIRRVVLLSVPFSYPGVPTAFMTGNASATADLPTSLGPTNPAPASSPVDGPANGARR